MTNLFDETERTFLGPARYNETSFNFYNRSARENILIIRETLNEWFSFIPDSEKKEFKARFKKSFDSAFYELFLYNLFKNLGFSIEIHPNLPNTTKKPDFLIQKNDLMIYIEAKISKDKSAKQEAFERMQNAFYDSLNKIYSENFMLSVEKIKFISGFQPKTKLLIAYIETELSKLNPDNVSEEMRVHGVHNIRIEYTDNDIHIILNPLPVIPRARTENTRRAIGIFPFESFSGGGEESLKESLESKSKRYGELNKPFIVCVNALSKNTTSFEDVDNAIWGSLALAFYEDPIIGVEKWVRQPDGIFMDESGPKRTNLTGVLVTQVFPSTIPNSNYWLYKNPFSQHTLDFQKLGLKFNFVQDGNIHSETGNDLDEILKIDKSWLKK